ncbi:hypothetical protein [Clostridium estertheticum]|uniref:hypothetical protein n=1 Tax=Clostridium estertheticum TaxID=238834 RepID=UPI001C7CA468|nr:hypothetical protein [Clostridium estertheticum]MBX4267151.1 hypothetical protein [Clostridium estertheticum]WLC82401.1 hypothetical protein KTC98_24050 [Clostridium estertheticum]WLC91274.1 hypothetical protein KTC95_24020 [Clostridium estertheticum]
MRTKETTKDTFTALVACSSLERIVVANKAKKNSTTQRIAPTSQLEYILCTC